jgi:NADH:ubiquinone oxidoreductase subunit 3 (subunit A)
MSYAPLAVLELLAVCVGIPALVAIVAVALAGRPSREPSIQTFLMLAVLTVVAIAMVFLVPFAASFGVLRHRESAALGLFLAVLVALGVGYAWRRDALRW